MLLLRMIQPFDNILSDLRKNNVFQRKTGNEFDFWGVIWYIHRRLLKYTEYDS